MKRAVLVGASAEARTLVRAALARHGEWELVEPPSLAAAERILTTGVVDLVVVGSLSARESADWFRALSRGPRLIFVSAAALDGGAIRELTSDLGVALVAYEPLTRWVFEAQLDRVLGEIAPPASVLDAEVDAAMGALFKEFGEALPSTLDELEWALDAARGGSNPEALEHLRLRAHRLRGTAGSYGFAAVGEAAGRIEDIVVALSASGDLDGACAGIERALAEARSAARQTRRPSSISSMSTIELTAARVLVVDDDPAFTAQVAELARRQLVGVESASGAAEALEKARSQAFDAVIIDVMPGGGEDPFALARALRSLPGKDQLPIAFVSEAATLQDRVEAAHAGASLFLTKPLDPYEVSAALDRLLAHGRAERPRVLAIDDDARFLAMLARKLEREGFAVTTSTNPVRALEELEACSPDLLILDVSMPRIGGLDVCRMLRLSPRWQDLPIFFLTARADVATRVAAFQAGGTDYLVKPVVREELLARVRTRLEHIRVLRERGDRDPLTQLLSRRAFLEALTVRVSEARRHGLALAVCMLDIDHFKHTNDTHGHLAGDRVLAGLGKLLKARFRLEDLRARWGGEEIAIAFPGASAETAAAIVRRILEETREMTFRGDHDEAFHVTFSAGVAELDSAHGDVEALLRTADKRLYVAKREGRARVMAG